MMLAAVAAAALALIQAPSFAGAEPAQHEAAPGASTGAAHAIGASTELTGTVNPRGLVTTYYFEYGPSEKDYTSKTPQAELKAVYEAKRVRQIVTGFREGDYRLVASNAKGRKEGKNREYSATGSKKSNKAGFELPSTFQPTLVGEGFTFAGTLTGPGNSGRAVVLQASPYPYSAAFTDVAGPIPTTATGRFSFHIAAVGRNTRFRAATVTAPLLYSDSVTELAKVHVTLKAQTNKLVKDLVRLYGTVSPAAAGANVFLQLEKLRKPAQTKAERPEKPSRSERAEEEEEKPIFATRFKTVVKHATRKFSRFSIVVRLQESGAYRAYIQMPPGPYASGESATVSLTGARKKAKH